MNIDWDALLYDPLYANFGTAAVLTPLAGPSVAATVIDYTQGVEIAAGVELPVVRPACFIRRLELDDAGLVEQDMLGGAVSMNGNVWTVSDIRQRPGPKGKNTGEIVFILIGTAGTA